MKKLFLLLPLSLLLTGCSMETKKYAPSEQSTTGEIVKETTEATDLPEIKNVNKDLGLVLFGTSENEVGDLLGKSLEVFNSENIEIPEDINNIYLITDVAYNEKEDLLKYASEHFVVGDFSKFNFMSSVRTEKVSYKVDIENNILVDISKDNGSYKVFTAFRDSKISYIANFN